MLKLYAKYAIPSGAATAKLSRYLSVNARRISYNSCEKWILESELGNSQSKSMPSNWYVSRTDITDLINFWRLPCLWIIWIISIEFDGPPIQIRIFSFRFFCFKDWICLKVSFKFPSMSILLPSIVATPTLMWVHRNASKNEKYFFFYNWLVSLNDFNRCYQYDLWSDHFSNRLEPWNSTLICAGMLKVSFVGMFHSLYFHQLSSTKLWIRQNKEPTKGQFVYRWS